jgi:hypothetical protein
MPLGDSFPGRFAVYSTYTLSQRLIHVVEAHAGEGAP